MSAKVILISVTIAAFAYPLVMRLLLDAVQPMRLKMADLGNELLDDESLPEVDKRAVASMMDDAFEWQFMAFAVFKAPKFAWARFRGKRLADPLAKIPKPEQRKKVSAMIEYFTLSTAAANPVFFILVCIEILTITPILRFLKAFGDDSGRLRDVTRRVVMRAECEFSESMQCAAASSH